MKNKAISILLFSGSTTADSCLQQEWSMSKIKFCQFKTDGRVKQEEQLFRTFGRFLYSGYWLVLMVPNCLASIWASSTSEILQKCLIVLMPGLCVVWIVKHRKWNEDQDNILFTFWKFLFLHTKLLVSSFAECLYFSQGSFFIISLEHMGLCQTPLFCLL